MKAIDLVTVTPPVDDNPPPPLTIVTKKLSDLVLAMGVMPFVEFYKSTIEDALRHTLSFNVVRESTQIMRATIRSIETEEEAKQLVSTATAQIRDAVQAKLQEILTEKGEFGDDMKLSVKVFNMYTYNNETLSIQYIF